MSDAKIARLAMEAFESAEWCWAVKALQPHDTYTMELGRLRAINDYQLKANKAWADLCDACAEARAEARKSASE